MEKQHPPFIDVLTQHQPSTTPAEPIYPWYTSRRFRIFISTFFITSIIGLMIVFLQTSIYQSSTTLLTVAPTSLDEDIKDINIQHVAIQANVLTSQSLINATREALAKLSNDDIPDPISLRTMLSVQLVADTNLIKLTAEGDDPGFLALFLNTLIDQYQIQRVQQINDDTANTTLALQQQLSLLVKDTEQKRNDIDIFRIQHNILSVGRDENQVAARLNGLTTSLNTAEADEINAKAKLDAIKKAISRGRPVVPNSDKRSLANLEKRAQELSEQLSELDRRYTRQYMALQPELRVIPEQLEKLRAEIRRQKIDGQNIVLSDAEQDYSAAYQATKALKNEIERYKDTATEFTRRFSEHEALVEDLAQLEDRYRETQARLTEIAVIQRDKYPQFKTIEPAFKPNKPIRPNYLLNSGFSLVLAFALGLVAIWLFEFLKKDSARVTNPGIATWSRITNQDDKLNLQQNETDKLAYTQTRPHQALSSHAERPLNINEVEQLFIVSSLKGQLVLSCLLQGLSLAEIYQLSKLTIDTQKNTFNTPIPPIRTLPLSKKLAELLHKITSLEFAENEVSSLISCAIYDADIQKTGHISAEDIRHNYIRYLLQQGIKIADLEKTIGPISSHILTEYEQSNDRQDLAAINLIYPLLAS